MCWTKLSYRYEALSDALQMLPSTESLGLPVFQVERQVEASATDGFKSIALLAEVTLAIVHRAVEFKWDAGIGFQQSLAQWALDDITPLQALYDESAVQCITSLKLVLRKLMQRAHVHGLKVVTHHAYHLMNRYPYFPLSFFSSYHPLFCFRSFCESWRPHAPKGPRVSVVRLTLTTAQPTIFWIPDVVILIGILCLLF